MSQQTTGAPELHVCLVAARGRNGVIGAEGDLPWRLPTDLKRFKAITAGKPVVMGRKTWESLPRRPLPGRLNIVVTRQAEYAAEGARVAADLDAAIALAVERAAADGVDEVCVIGGGGVYAEALKRADRLYLTEVNSAPAGDIRFPDFDEAQWREIAREARMGAPGDDHDMVFRTLERV